MADFCGQCMKEKFGEGIPSDFEGEAPEGETVSVICEGCGFIEVDHTGDRVRFLDNEESEDDVA